MTASPLRLQIYQQGSETPVIFSHGLGDDSATWRGVTSHVAQQHRVVTWDLRGHGGSDSPSDPEQYSPGLALADLERVVNMTGSPVALVGHSLGGYLSLSFALERPELVSALVLISSGPGFRDSTARDSWNSYVDHVSRRFSIPPAAARLCYHENSWVIDHCGELTVPLLQIAGDGDKRYLAGAQVLHRKVSGSKLIVIDGASHHPQETHAARVAEAITAHLSGS